MGPTSAMSVAWMRTNRAEAGERGGLGLSGAVRPVDQLCVRCTTHHLPNMLEPRSLVRGPEARRHLRIRPPVRPSRHSRHGAPRDDLARALTSVALPSGTAASNKSFALTNVQAARSGPRRLRGATCTPSLKKAGQFLARVRSGAGSLPAPGSTTWHANYSSNPVARARKGAGARCPASV
jgi:hypothetical protein